MLPLIGGTHCDVVDEEERKESERESEMSDLPLEVAGVMSQ